MFTDLELPDTTAVADSLHCGVQQAMPEGHSKHYMMLLNAYLCVAERVNPFQHSWTTATRLTTEDDEVLTDHDES